MSVASIEPQWKRRARAAVDQIKTRAEVIDDATGFLSGLEAELHWVSCINPNAGCYFANIHDFTFNPALDFIAARFKLLQTYGAARVIGRMELSLYIFEYEEHTVPMFVPEARFIIAGPEEQLLRTSLIPDACPPVPSTNLVRVAPVEDWHIISAVDDVLTSRPAAHLIEPVVEEYRSIELTGEARDEFNKWNSEAGETDRYLVFGVEPYSSDLLSLTVDALIYALRCRRRVGRCAEPW